MPWVKNKFGATVWVSDPTDQSDANAPEKPKGSGGTSGGGATSTTNQWGGPKGTKKDAAGHAYGDAAHARFGGGSGSSGSTGKTPKAVADPGVDKAAAQAAADARAAAEEAARIAAEKAAEEARRRILKQAGRVQADFEAQSAKREADRQAAIDANAAAQTKLASAQKSGNKAAIAAANASLQASEKQLMAIEVAELKARGRKLRSDAYNEIEEKNTIATATRGTVEEREAEKDSDGPLDRAERVRERYGKTNPLLDQTQVNTGKLKPGDRGYDKKVDIALAKEVQWQADHPEDYDPEVLTIFGQAKQRHIDAITRKQIQENKKITAQLEIYNDESKTPEQRNAALKKMQQLRKEGRENRQEQKRVFGTDPTTNPAGKIIKPGREGTLANTAAQFDYVYDAAVQYQNELVAQGGLPSFIENTDPELLSPVIRAANENPQVIWDGYLDEDNDGVPEGGYRYQEPVERLIEMFVSGEAEEILNAQQEAGQDQLIDIAARRTETLNDPILSHLYRNFDAAGVTGADDLQGDLNTQRRETLIEQSVDDAFAARQLQPDYVLPSVANPQYYDISNYTFEMVPDEAAQAGIGYGYEQQPQFIVEGVGPVSPAEWLPEYGEPPPWDAMSDPDVLQDFAYSADVRYQIAEKQKIEDAIRAELRVEDPGALGDAMRTGLGTSLQGLGVILYDASVVAQGVSGGRFGLNAPGMVTDDIGKANDDPTNQGWTQGSIITNEMIEAARTNDGTGRYVEAANLGYAEEGEAGWWEGALSFILGPVQTTIDDTQTGERITRYTLPFADQLPINIEVTHRTSPEIREELQQELFELADIAGREGEPIEQAKALLEKARATGNSDLIRAAEAELDAVRRSGAGTFLGLGHGVSLQDVGTRVRILTEHGEFFTEGNLAGIGNFLLEMAVDATNFLPFLSMAKRGLAGVSGAYAAGKIPAGSKTLKLARMADEFKAGIMRNPRLADEMAGFDDSLAKVLANSQAGQMDEVDRLILLRQALAGIKLPTDPEEQVTFITKLLRKQGGFDDLGVDPQLLKNWVEEQLYFILRERYNLFNTDLDTAAAQVKNAKIHGDPAAALRAKAARDSQKVADQIEEADKVARAKLRKQRADEEAAEAAKKADEAEAARKAAQPKEGDPGTIPGSGGTLTGQPHPKPKAEPKKPAPKVEKKVTPEVQAAPKIESVPKAKKPRKSGRSVEQLRNDVGTEQRRIKDLDSQLARNNPRLNRKEALRKRELAAGRLKRALDRGQAEYGIDLRATQRAPKSTRPVQTGKRARVVEKPFDDEALTEGVQRGAPVRIMGDVDDVTREALHLNKGALRGRTFYSNAHVEPISNLSSTRVVDIRSSSIGNQVGIKISDATYTATEGTSKSPLRIYDPINLPDRQLDDLPVHVNVTPEDEYRRIWEFEPTGSDKFRAEEDLLCQNTRATVSWDSGTVAWEGKLTVDSIPFIPDSYIRESPEAMFFRARLSHPDKAVREAAYTRLWNMAKQEHGEVMRLSTDKVPHDFDRTLLGITDDASMSRAAYEAAAVRHIISEARKAAKAARDRAANVPGAPKKKLKAPEAIRPYRGAYDEEDELARQIIDDLGENVKPYIENDAAGDFYQSFHPWDPKDDILDLPVETDDSLHRLLNIITDADNRKIIVEGGDNAADLLGKAKAFALRVQSVSPRNPVQAFRIRNQFGYDLFHRLLGDAEAAGDKGYEVLRRMHDEVFERAFDAKTGELVDDDVLVNWLLMEARSGMDFALPHDVIEKIAMDLMAKNGILPHEGLRMFNPTYTARRTTRHLRVDPSLHGLYRAPNGKTVDGAWTADPDPSWVKDGGSEDWFRSGFRQLFNRFGPRTAKTPVTNIARATRYITSYITATTLRYSTWMGTSPRWQALRHGINTFGSRSLTPEGKFVSRAAEKEVKQLFVAYIDEAGGLPDFHVLEPGGKAIRNEQTGAVIALGSKEAKDLGVKFPKFDDFVRAINSGTPEKELGFDIGSAYEKAIGRGLVTPDNPFEATFHYLADRQWWGGGSYAKSTRYLDYMDSVGMGDQAREMVMNLYEGGLRMFEVDLVSAVARGGRHLDELLETPKGKFYKRLTGKSDTEFKEAALAAPRPDATELSEEAAERAARQEIVDAEDAALMGVHEPGRGGAYASSLDDLVAQHVSVLDDAEAMAVFRKFEDLKEAGVEDMFLRGSEVAALNKVQKAAAARLTQIIRRMFDGDEITDAMKAELKAAQAAADKAGVRLAERMTSREWKLIEDLKKRAYAAQARVANSLVAPNVAADEFDGIRELALQMLADPVYGGAPSVKRMLKHVETTVRGTPMPRANTLTEPAQHQQAVRKLVADSSDKIARQHTALKARIRTRLGDGRYRYQPLSGKTRPERDVLAKADKAKRLTDDAAREAADERLAKLADTEARSEAAVQKGAYKDEPDRPYRARSSSHEEAARNRRRVSDDKVMEEPTPASISGRTAEEQARVDKYAEESEKELDRIMREEYEPHEDGLPPPAPGHIRLYRGEFDNPTGVRGESVKGGDWFTTRYSIAKRYGDHVIYRDTPYNPVDMPSYAQGHGGVHEYVIQDPKWKSGLRRVSEDQVGRDYTFADSIARSVRAADDLDAKKAADELAKTRKEVQKAYDEGDLKKAHELQEEAEVLSAKAGKGGIQDTEVMRLEAGVIREMDKMSKLSEKMEPRIKEWEELTALGDSANIFQKQRLIALGRELDGMQQELDNLANEVAIFQKQLDDLPAARRAAAQQQRVDETLDDIARDEARQVAQATDEEPPLPEFREVPLSGPDPETVAHVRAAVVANDMGLSEEQWLRRLYQRNKKVISNRNTTKEARAEAKQSNRDIARAMRNIRVERYNGTYKAPKVKYDAAYHAANQVASEVEGVIPPKLIGYFARTVEGVKTEMARSIHIMLKTRNIRSGGIVGLRKFKPEHWERITDEVAEAIRQVQPRRASPIGLRTVRDEAEEAVDNADNLLRSRTDARPAVVRAKRDALRKVQDDLGIPKDEQINIQEYDRIRTLLQPHIGRKNRGIALLKDATRAGGDYREQFLKLRKEKADRNAVDNVAWTMLENPGMTVDDAVQHLKTSWYDDGTLRRDPLEITQEDASVLRRFFEHTTGANMDNQDEVIKALGDNGTLPPMTNKHRFRTHQEETGEWSPRALDKVEERGAWPIEDETAWWMARYGQAPRWLTDERILSGAAMKDRATYMAVMSETGNYDETARIARELGPDQNIAIKDLAHGNPEKGLSAAKSTEAERAYMIQRYGKRVSDDGVTLKECPWLMNSDEIAAYQARNLVDGGIPGVIKNADDIKAVQEAVRVIATKYADAYTKLPGATGDVVLDPESINEMAFEAVRELATTTPWRTPLEAVKQGGKVGLAQRALQTWQWLWTTNIVSNPAFTLLNSTDIPLRGTWFGITDPLARAGRRVTQATKDRIKTIDALGLGDSHAFSNGFPTRDAWDRARKGYSAWDRSLGVLDMFTNSIPRKILGRVEDTTKLRIGRQLYQGMMDDKALMKALRERALAQGLTLSDDEIDVLVKIQVKKRLNKWFPTLANAGPAEKLLNAVFPFTSYYAKNQIIWIGEMLDHPWALNAINKWNEALVEHNMREWDEMNPDNPGRMPEHLRHQIRLPWSDGDGAPIYLDVGTFIDATRGMEMLFNKDVTYSDVLGHIFRPLPTQVAFFKDLAYRGTNKWAFGRKKYVKRIDPETGLIMFDENGNILYDEVTVPPGTPWGDDGFDYLADMIWAVDFVNEMSASSEIGFVDKLWTATRMMTFGSITRPSQYFMLNQHYFALQHNDPEAARAWLNTPDGQRLQNMWNQSSMEPTDLVLNPFALTYGPDDPIPTAEDIRRRWLGMQPPEAKDELFQVFNDASAMNTYWDDYMADIEDPAELREMWEERTTFFNAYYAEHPNVAYYWGMGMSPEEFDDWKGQQMIDEEVGEFFSLFSWDSAPGWDKPKQRKSWEEDRQAYIDKNPVVAKFLAETKSAFDRSNDLLQKAYKSAAKVHAQTTIMRDAAYAADNLKGVKAAQAIAEGASIVYSAEVFGDDNTNPEKGSKFRWQPDKLTRALKAAGGNEKARRDALYEQRMDAAARKATDKNGNFDPWEWHRILDRHEDLRDSYLLKNPKKRETWEVHGEYLKMWDRFGRLADAGLWEQAYAAYDNASPAVKEYMREHMPKKFAKWERDSRYNAMMGHWTGLFDQGRGKEAMAYFNSLPNWAKERYYSNHKGTALNSGTGSQYVQNLNTVFSLIDKGDWDAAERAWNAMPAWQRKRYYANNPDSTLFRGKGGSGGSSGGGMPDAKYKKYIGHMTKWVDLLKDGREEEAKKYFASLPAWVKEQYTKTHPDKALLKESLRMQTLVEDYLLANKAHQQQMLEDSPALARWLNDNDAGAAWRNAVQYAYTQLPDDPWLKRVYREKYPEIFSDEAVGQAKIDDVMETLGEHPELAQPWLKWYKHIAASLAEAMKYMSPRPKEFHVERAPRKPGGHHGGMSADEVGQRVEKWLRSSRTVNKRLPMPEG